METKDEVVRPTCLKFEEVVTHADLIAGVKAVYGRVTVRALCFSSHGHPQGSDAYFSLPRGVAKQFDTRPFVITIGGGRKVLDGLRSRVTNVVRLTGAYGETNTFITDPTLRKQLSQWPASVMAAEVLAVEGYPHLPKDLGFENKQILVQAYDRVLLRLAPRHS